MDGGGDRPGEGSVPEPGEDRAGEAGDGAGEAGGPKRRRLAGWGGCLGWMAGFMVVAIVGFGVGVVLRPDPPTEPEQVANGQGWVVEVRRSEGDDPCVELFTGGGGDPRAGQCGFAVDEGDYQSTSFGVGGNTTVIFGPVPEKTARVRLDLANGDQPTVEVEEANSVRYFLYRSPAEVGGPTRLLDADGRMISLGG